MTQTAPEARIAEMADLCVKCGFCMPYCPTYALTMDENESPRGRIALMEAVAKAELEPSGPVKGHLDHCLDCRACEKVCPVDVPYGRLLNDTRALTRGISPLKWYERLKIRWLAHPRTLIQIARLGWLAERFGLRHLIPYLPKQSSWPHRVRTRRWDAAEAVTIFAGCAVTAFESGTLDNAAKLLERLGFGVHVDSEACCGALHAHAGLADDAEKLREDNRARLQAEPSETILSFASGCHETIGQSVHKKHFANFYAFLNANWDEALRLEAIDAPVYLHIPCTQRNLTDSTPDVIALLKRIPKIDLRIVSEQGCCGASGLYMLEFPDWSKKLREKHLEHLDTSAPFYLLTSNVGCRLHLSSGLHAEKNLIAVSSVVDLLAKQLA